MYFCVDFIQNLAELLMAAVPLSKPLNLSSVCLTQIAVTAFSIFIKSENCCGMKLALITSAMRPTTTCKQMTYRPFDERSTCTQSLLHHGFIAIHGTK